MHYAQRTRGIALPGIIALIAVILLGGGLWYANTTKNEDMMEEKAGDMMEKGDEMMKEGEEMTKEGESMMKEGEAMMSKDIVVSMTGQSGFGQTGKATLSDTDGKTKVVIDIPAGAAGVPQPAHIHAGACPTPGAVVYPLTAVVGGKSETTLDVSLDTLSKGLPLAINVHKSKDEAKVYTSCGDIPESIGSAMMKKDGDTTMEKDSGTMTDNGTMQSQ